MGLANQTQTTPPFAPQTKYSQALTKGRPGQTTNDNDEFRQVLTGLSNVNIPYGCFVAFDPTQTIPQTATAQDINQLIPVKIPAAASDITGLAALGIALQTLEKESSQDSLNPYYPPTSAIPVMQNGQCYVAVEKQVTAKQYTAYVRYATSAAANEVQNLQFQAPYGTQVSGCTGQITLGFKNQFTPPITLTGVLATDATAIQNALGALAGIGAPNITAVSDGAGGFNITFQTALGNAPQSFIQVLYQNVVYNGNPAQPIVTQTTQGTAGYPAGSISPSTDSGKNALIPTASLVELSASQFNPITLQWISSLRLNLIK